MDLKLMGEKKHKKRNSLFLIQVRKKQLDPSEINKINSQWKILMIIGEKKRIIKEMKKIKRDVAKIVQDHVLKNALEKLVENKWIVI